MPDIFQDWDANARSAKGRVVMALFRIGAWLRTKPYWLAFPYHGFYQFVVEWVLGIELRTTTRVGAGLGLHHGVGLVVNDRVVIGANCVLRQNTTIGNREDDSEAPILEDGVNVGANVVILGGVRIGRGATIGAGAVVIADVAPGATMVGNPARAVGSSNDA
jgi:serine acetyltransferase